MKTDTSKFRKLNWEILGLLAVVSVAIILAPTGAHAQNCAAVPAFPTATQGDVRALERSNGDGVYQELFRVDTGAADSIAPASELEKIGIVPVGRTTCNLPDGNVGECSFGLARIEFVGEMKEGRIIFGSEDVKPVLGVSALESIGFTVDPATRTLKRLSSAE